MISIASTPSVIYYVTNIHYMNQPSAFTYGMISDQCSEDDINNVYKLIDANYPQVPPEVWTFISKQNNIPGSMLSKYYNDIKWMYVILNNKLTIAQINTFKRKIKDAFGYKEFKENFRDQEHVLFTMRHVVTDSYLRKFAIFCRDNNHVKSTALFSANLTNWLEIIKRRMIVEKYIRKENRAKKSQVKIILKTPSKTKKNKTNRNKLKEDKMLNLNNLTHIDLLNVIQRNDSKYLKKILKSGKIAASRNEIQDAVRFGRSDCVRVILENSAVIPVYDNVINAIRNNHKNCVAELLKVKELVSVEKIALYMHECSLTSNNDIAITIAHAMLN
ncbi:MAG: hypothetical protein ACRCZI_02815 [Cetobacterium sp.]